MDSIKFSVWIWEKQEVFQGEWEVERPRVLLGALAHAYKLCALN